MVVAQLEAKVAPAVVTDDGASVTTTSAAGAKPAGVVSWTVTSTTTGQTVPCASETTTLESNGNASCKIAADELSPAASPYVATVSYAGNSSFDASTQTLTVPVFKTNTRTRLTLTPPDQQGSPASLTATVSGVEPSSAGDPTGTLNFFVSSPAGLVPCDGGTNSFTLSSGAATCQLDLAPLPQGWHYRVETSYSGDANFNPNVSTGGWRHSRQRPIGITTTTTDPGSLPAPRHRTPRRRRRQRRSRRPRPRRRPRRIRPPRPARPVRWQRQRGSRPATWCSTTSSPIWTTGTPTTGRARWNNLGNLPSPYSGGNQPDSNDMAFYSPTQDVLMSGGGVALEATPTASSPRRATAGRAACSRRRTRCRAVAGTSRSGRRCPTPVQGSGRRSGRCRRLGPRLDGFEGGWPGSSPNEQGHSDTFASSGQIQQVWPTPSGVDISSGYNTYGFQYIPGTGMRFYFNGTQVYSSSADLSTEDYYLFLQLQVASSQTVGLTPPEAPRLAPCRSPRCRSTRRTSQEGPLAGGRLSDSP